MEELNILFLSRNGEGCVGAPQTFHEFETAVGKIANCKWAGKGHPLHRVGESMGATVARVMPDADWVIADRDNTWSLPEKRDYKVGVFLSDLHGKYNMGIGTPTGFCELINSAGFDAVFMKYMEVHGHAVDPHIFENNLNCKVYHVPWSVDCDKHRWVKKRVDATFIGSHQRNIYPLRDDMFNNMLYHCKGYTAVREQSPHGKTYERRVNELKKTYYVGDKYVKLLNESKIMLFDSSKYRYPIQKFFEASASACLIISDEPSTAKKLGFINEKTYLDVNGFDWEDTFIYALENYESVKHIARNALKNAVIHHSHEARAVEWLEMLKQ